MADNDLFIVRNRPMMKGLTKLFILYVSIYGIVSIFTENVMIRGTKDAVLILLILGCLWNFIFTKDNKQIGLKITILLLLVSLSIIGALGNINSGNLVTYTYGMKITIIPIGALLIGIWAKKYHISLDKVLIAIFFTSIFVWVLQYQLGVDYLISMGFEYGKNLKHIDGFPRLPSIAGTPDGYAFLLCITGILVEYSNTLSEKKKTRMCIKLLTLAFLLLSTIRSALVLWIVFQFLMFIPKIRRATNRHKLLSISAIFYIICFLIIAWLAFLSDSKLGMSSSLVDRLSHWGKNAPQIDTLEGWVGTGIGNVGSASLRLNDLGSRNDEYAVDNQFLALYEQVGIIGTLVFLAFITILILRLKKNSKDNEQSSVALSLFLATLVSCIFTNVLEMYPFNVMFWIYIGSNIAEYKNKVVTRREFNRLKKSA
ncbi:O-antigen ligase family protein [Bacillus paramycoides]|uniref:O-antigen ligase family protein n=1 Tax=Bacillus paramycoides TaxID=2026194 RepID=UPI003821704B